MKSKQSSSDLVQLIRFFRETQTKPTYFILAGCLSCISAIFAGVSAGLLIFLTKGLIAENFNLQLFFMLIGLVFVTAVAKNLLSYAALLASLYQSEQVVHHARKLLFARYLSYGKLFFDRTNIGSLISPLLRSLIKVKDMLLQLSRSLVSFFVVVVYLVIMWIISWKLTVLVALMVPLIGYVIKPIVKKVRERSSEVTEAHANLVERAANVLSCVQLVKSYSSEEEEKERFDEASEELARVGFKMKKPQEFVLPLQEILTLTGVLFLTSAVAFLSVRGQFSNIPVFLVYLYLLKSSMNAFRDFTLFRAHLAGVRGPMSEMLTLLNAQDKPFVQNGNQEFNGIKKSIEFCHLNFSYGEGIPVLNDVNFSVEKGKMTAIVGSSGSGKTTLVHLLMRFYNPPPNSILIDGVDIQNFTLGSLMAEIAFVGQDPLLFNDTLRNNIVYGLNGSYGEDRLTDVAKRARLYDFVQTLPQQFDTHIGDRGVKLSGGEKQRVAFARTFYKGSEILVLDEATSSMDTQTEKLIQEAIDEVTKDRTVIVVAHRLSTIRKADKIVVVEGGRVVEEGVLEELLDKKGKFSQYWEAQKFDEYLSEAEI